jgi:MFS family permease
MPGSPSSPPTLRLLQRRTMRVLVVAQLLGACGLAAGGTAGALLAEQLSGGPAAAGLPLAMLVLGSGLAAVVVTRVMSSHGRRVGLSAAYLAGAVGAGQVVAAAAWGSWPLLLAGCGLLGGGNAAVMLARYAAADLASRRARSISVVVAAASVGAVVGPNLLGPAGALAGAVGLPAPTGLFLLAIPAFLGAALVLVLFLRPDPLQVAEAATPTTRRPATAGGRAELASLLGDHHVRLALLVLGAANLSMVGVMAVTPVHLHDHGVGMGTIGLLISAHIAAMYLPSPLTGWLADAFRGRPGRLRPRGDHRGAAAARGRMERRADRRQRPAPCRPGPAVAANPCRGAGRAGHGRRRGGGWRRRRAAAGHRWPGPARTGRGRALPADPGRRGDRRPAPPGRRRRRSGGEPDDAGGRRGGSRVRDDRMDRTRWKHG